MSLEKIHEPLNEAQRQPNLREKECERLQREVTNLKKPNESQANCRIDLEDKEATNNFQSSRRQVHTRFQNSFYGYCFNCYRFGHKAIDCRIPIRRNVTHPRKKFWEKNHAQNQNPYLTLLEEIECSKCNNFGHTVE